MPHALTRVGVLVKDFSPFRHAIRGMAGREGEASIYQHIDSSSSPPTQNKANAPVEGVQYPHSLS